MSEELLAVLRKIVAQCSETMLASTAGGYVIKDLVLSLAEIRTIDKAVKREMGR